MKRLGLVGGIAPPSTVDYYRRLVAGALERTGRRRYPPLLIDSIDLGEVVRLAEAGEWTALADLLLPSLERLERGGADLAAFASNTPHRIFDELQARSPLPLVSLVEAAADRARSLGFRRLALFGARFTMEGGFYSRAFERSSMTVVTPSAEERALIHERYFGELVQGVFREETRRELCAIARRLRDDEGVAALILGGTELPLLLDDEAQVGLPCLDTTGIHVDRLLDAMLEDSTD